MNKFARVEYVLIPQVIIVKSAYLLGFPGTMSNGSVPISRKGLISFAGASTHTFLGVMVHTETVLASDN